jgi:hypothetical protein
MKPINGLLSIGVIRVENQQALAKTFADTDALMTDSYLDKDGNMGRISTSGGIMPEVKTPPAPSASFQLVFEDTGPSSGSAGVLPRPAGCSETRLGRGLGFHHCRKAAPLTSLQMIRVETSRWLTLALNPTGRTPAQVRADGGGVSGRDGGGYRCSDV